MRAPQALPARYPPSGAWPAQMRADMAAAYLDFRCTAELVAAIKRGDAPAPSSLRGKGRKQEPVWSRVDLDRHIAPLSPRLQDDRVRENLASLI
jgi:hypothetical protein